MLTSHKIVCTVCSAKTNLGFYILFTVGLFMFISHIVDPYNSAILPKGRQCSLIDAFPCRLFIQCVNLYLFGTFALFCMKQTQYCNITTLFYLPCSLLFIILRQSSCLYYIQCYIFKFTANVERKRYSIFMMDILDYEDFSTVKLCFNKNGFIMCAVMWVIK